MGLQIFDDGSTLTTDQYGNVVAVTDSSGSAVQVAQPDTLQQIQNTLLSGLNQAIMRAVSPKQTTTVYQPTATKAASMGVGQIVALFAMGVGAFLLFKAVSK